MRRTGVALVVLGLVVLGVAQVDRVAVGGGPGFLGSWQFTITEVSPAGEASNPSLVTFFADGAMIVHDLPARAAPAGFDAEAILRGGGHGVWADAETGGVAFTFVALATTDAGLFLGTGTVSGTGTLDASGDAISGPYVAAAVGEDGQSLGSGAGTFSGTRIQLQPLE